MSQINAFLIISKFGSLRVVKSRPFLNNTEIAIQLAIDIPQVFFERLMPVVNIKLHKEAVINTNMETVINITAQTIFDHLNLSVVDVEDGLRQLLTQPEKGSN